MHSFFSAPGKRKTHRSFPSAPDHTQGTIEFCRMIIPPHAFSNTQAQSHKGEETAFSCRKTGETGNGRQYLLYDPRRQCAHPCELPASLA